jgi:hypothetical protein
MMDLTARLLPAFFPTSKLPIGDAVERECSKSYKRGTVENKKASRIAEGFRGRSF